MKNNYLAEIISSLEKIKQDSQKTFGGLDPEQLNWKPAEDVWSIGQCFNHLILTNNIYLSEISSVLNRHEDKNFWKKVPLLTKFFGNFLRTSFAPGSSRKFKAPQVLKPSGSFIDKNIIKDFAEHQNKLIEMINQSDKFDLDRTIITSPVSKFVTFSLKDTFNLFVMHEQRHFSQAKAVLNSEKFSK